MEGNSERSLPPENLGLVGKMKTAYIKLQW